VDTGYFNEAYEWYVLQALSMNTDIKTGAAFVAGATGFTGREVVRILAGQDVPVVAHVRPDSPVITEWRERFGALGAKVDTTPWQQDRIAETFIRLKPRIVFSLLGTTRARGRKAAGSGRVDNYETVDYALTAMLIHALGKAGLQPRFIYLSAAGVKKGTKNPYYGARWKTEDLLRRSGIPFTIARPSIITGRGRDEGRPMERMGAAVVDRALAAAAIMGGSKLRNRYRSTTNVILAGALVRLAFDPDAENRIVESEDLRQP